LKQTDVVVVGAGLAGLSAAVALARAGADVTLMERRPFVGGRAYSYLHPALDEVVDSQHVLLGCCTNLIDLCKQADLEDKIRWYDRQTFLEPATATRGVKASTIELGRLPAPLMYTGSFLKPSMLSPLDKLAVARALMGFRHGEAGADSESAAQWYRRTGQTQGAIRHFWEPILLATLNDSAENCSMKYAGKVFYELFLKTSAGGRLGIPTIPLSEFYDSVALHFESLGGHLQQRASVDRLQPLSDGRWSVSAGEHTVEARNVILALPFEQTERLLAPLAAGNPAAAALSERISHFVHSPFISILLWYDRQITDLDHAWLLDTTIQWFFHKSKIRRYAPDRGSYVELVIAGSKAELPLNRAQILEPALAELQRFFPDAGKARLLKSGILKEARATFSVTPGLDAFRPEQRTELRGLYLAGDWTATGWPSTMEGAARSGRLAAGALAGDQSRFLVPELAPTGISSLLAH
jgi:zeta-carotene desaturase